MPRTTGDYRHEGEKLLKVMVAKRKAARVTQVELAEKIKLPQPILSKIENGGRELLLVEYLQYMVAIGADPIEPLKAILRRVSA